MGGGGRTDTGVLGERSSRLYGIGWMKGYLVSLERSPSLKGGGDR